MDRDDGSRHGASERIEKRGSRPLQVPRLRLWHGPRPFGAFAMGDRRRAPHALRGPPLHQSVLNMKISRSWLQTFFKDPLPEAKTLADALTFHAFEIESIENDVLDVKVTPNRGHDCLSHRGIAKELSAILNVPMKGDPLRMEVSLTPTTNEVSVSIDETQLCPRYIAGLIRGAKVGPSPHWLRNFLESIGQKSINNIVDATNFVMFSLGQPLHAFDAGQLSKKEAYAIGVRRAKVGEKLLALDEKEYVLAENMLVITDRHADAAIGIAGVKGGKPAGISETTTDIIIESANFDGVSTRKTASALKLRTDASM